MILRGAGRSLVVLNLVLPPQRLRPDTRPELQDPVSHTAQKKREKKRKKIKINFFKLLKLKINKERREQPSQ